MSTTSDTPSKPVRLREILGLSCAMLTPFTKAGAIDWQRFGSHASNLLASGVKAVTAFGTTGEGISLSRAERAPLYAEFAKHGVPADKIVECVYGPSSQDAGDHVRAALDAGCAAILLTPPFYFKGPSEEGVFNWFCEVFDRAGEGVRDIIVYNIPSLTAVTITPELVSRLRQRYPDAIGGVKDSSGDWDQTQAFIKTHPDLAILVGHEGYLAQAIKLGASGSISGLANLAPKTIAKLVEGTHEAVIDEALDVILSRPIVPGLKVAMVAQTGDPEWARVRAPLVSFTDADDIARCKELAGKLA